MYLYHLVGPLGRRYFRMRAPSAGSVSIRLVELYQLQVFLTAVRLAITGDYGADGFIESFDEECGDVIRGVDVSATLYIVFDALLEVVV